MGVSRFVLEKADEGAFSFSLVSGGGQILATGGQYRTRTAAVNAIRSVKGNAPDAMIEDRTEVTDSATSGRTR